MNMIVQEIIGRAEHWPLENQEEPAQLMLEIELRRKGNMSSPRIDQFQSVQLEMRPVSRRQRGAVAERDGGDHAVGNRKLAATARGFAHDLAIDDCRWLVEGVDAAREVLPRLPEEAFERPGPLIRPDALDAELYLSKDDSRQSQLRVVFTDTRRRNRILLGPHTLGNKICVGKDHKSMPLCGLRCSSMMASRSISVA